MYYCVMNLDLISSRKLADRNEVQEELKDALKKINYKFAEVIKVPFNFTLGDEVQGVLINLKSSYAIILEFQRFLAEHYFYVGVGYGEIVTQLSNRSGEMDGPAFHLAREGIETSKTEYAKTHGKRFVPLVHYQFADQRVTRIINNYLQMVELLKYQLTEKQREVYWLLGETDTYREIADYLSQSKSAITQKVQGGYIEEIRTGERGLVHLLEWVANQN